MLEVLRRCTLRVQNIVSVADIKCKHAERFGRRPEVVQVPMRDDTGGFPDHGRLGIALPPCSITHSVMDGVLSRWTNEGSTARAAASRAHRLTPGTITMVDCGASSTFRTSHVRISTATPLCGFSAQSMKMGGVASFWRLTSKRPIRQLRTSLARDVAMT